MRIKRNVWGHTVEVPQDFIVGLGRKEWAGGCVTGVVCMIMNIQGDCWLSLRGSGLDPLSTYLLITSLCARCCAGNKQAAVAGMDEVPALEVSALTGEVQTGHHSCVL